MTAALKKTNNLNVVELPISALIPNVNNPRTIKNSAWDELKTSLIAQGFDGVLDVTQRPNTDFYVPRKGGNTTLEIMKQLNEQDPAIFVKVPCRIFPWTNELDLLIAHGVENHSRGDMEFIDDANYIIKIIRHVLNVSDEEIKKTSVRLIQKELKSVGLSYSHPKITASLFFVDKVQPYLNKISVTANNGRGLNLSDVTKLLNTAKRYIAIIERLRDQNKVDGEPLSFSAVLVELDSKLSEAMSHNELIGLLTNELVKWSYVDRMLIKQLLLSTSEIKVKPPTNSSDAQETECITEKVIVDNVPSSESTNETECSKPSELATDLKSVSEDVKVTEFPSDGKGSHKKQIQALALEICKQANLEQVYRKINVLNGFYVDLPEEPIEVLSMSQVWWTLFLLSAVNDEQNCQLMAADSPLRKAIENKQLPTLFGDLGRPLSGGGLMTLLFENSQLCRLFMLVRAAKGVDNV